MFLLYKRGWRTRSNCEWLLPTALQLTFVIYRVLWRARSLLYRNRCLQIQAHVLRTFTQVDRLQKYVGKQLTQRDHSLRKFRRKSVNTVDALSYPLGILGLDRNTNEYAHLSWIDRITQTMETLTHPSCFSAYVLHLNYEMVRLKTKSWMNKISLKTPLSASNLKSKMITTSSDLSTN